MQIAIDTIPTNGVDVPIQLDLGWAASVASAVLEAPAEELTGKLHLIQRGQSVQVTGSLRCHGPRFCERCNEPVPLVLDTEVNLAYVPEADMAAGGSEIQLGAGDLDVGWYRGGVIVVDDVMSEALALALPTRVVCAVVSACDTRVSNLLASAAPLQRESAFAALKTML